MLKVSIVIPCYNHGEFILEAIESIEQCEEKTLYEIIIINDGSTDEFTNITLQNLKNKGYNVIFQENQGLGKTRNNGIKLAKGEYILPLDADNKINPIYITKSIEILDKNQEISVVYGNAEYFGEKNGLWNVGEFNKEKLLNTNFIDACTVFRKKDWEICGGYAEDMPFMGLEDWNFWLSLLKIDKKFYYLQEVCFYYRVSNNSMITLLQNEPFKGKYLKSYIFYKHIYLYADYTDPISAHTKIKNLENYIEKLKNDYENKIYNLKNSKSYKLCNFLLKPFRFLKKYYDSYSK